MKKKFLKIMTCSIAICSIFPYLSSMASTVYANEDNYVSQTEIESVASEFEQLFTKGIIISGNNYTFNHDYLTNNYTSDEIQAFIHLMDSTDLSPTFSKRRKRSIGSFAVCMKDKAVSDIADMFKVGAFVSFVQRKAWKEAAKFAVSWLAKNGIKRNVAATAALLSWYGIQCAGH